jgi:hypothetical protein
MTVESDPPFPRSRKAFARVIFFTACGRFRHNSLPVSQVGELHRVVNEGGSGSHRFGVGAGRAGAAARAWVVVCAIAFAPASSALAQGAASAVDSSEYTHTIEQAVERFRERDWNRARELFQAAHKLDPSARTLRGIGLTDFESGRYAIAIAELEAALADRRKPLDPQQRIEVQAVIAHARGFVGNLELEISPKGASVTIDRIPISGTSFSLDAGEHVIRASAAGYVDAEQTVRVLPADLTRAVLTLEPIAADKAELPVVATTSADSTQLTAAWIVGGIGVASAIVGGVFGVRSILKHNESDRYCGKAGSCDDPRGVSAMNAARSAGDISTVAFIAGGLALGAGTVLFLTAPSDDGAEHDQSAVSVQFGPGTVHMRGVF